MLNLRKWLAKSFPHKKTYISIVVIFLGFPYLVLLLFWFLDGESERLNRDTGVLDFEKNKVIYMKLLDCYKDTGDTQGCQRVKDLKSIFLSTVDTNNICGFSLSGREMTKYLIVKKGFSYDTDNYYAYALETDGKPLFFKENTEPGKEIVDLGNGWCVYLRMR